MVQTIDQIDIIAGSDTHNHETSLGGGYKLTTNYDKPGILDSHGKPVIGLDSFNITLFDGKGLFLGRARKGDDQNFTAATLPNTRMLILGDKFYDLTLKEQEMGYWKDEAVNMVLGHELTHIRVNELSEEEKSSIEEFYAQNWGLIYQFAEALVSREDYRSELIDSTQKQKAKKPATKTRTINIDGKIYEISVFSVVNEMLAFTSAAKMIDLKKLAELAYNNPTRQFICREKLSGIAYGVMQKIREIKDMDSIPGQNLYNGLENAIMLVRDSIPN